MSDMELLDDGDVVFFFLIHLLKEGGHGKPESDQSDLEILNH